MVLFKLISHFSVILQFTFTPNELTKDIDALALNLSVPISKPSIA